MSCGWRQRQQHTILGDHNQCDYKPVNDIEGPLQLIFPQANGQVILVVGVADGNMMKVSIRFYSTQYIIFLINFLETINDIILSLEGFVSFKLGYFLHLLHPTMVFKVRNFIILSSFLTYI